MPIIDCHVHLNYYPDIGNNRSVERMKKLLEAMSDNGVNYSLILSSYKSDKYRPSAAEIIEITKKHENNLGVVAGFTIMIIQLLVNQ